MPRMSALSETDHERVSAEIRAAESRTAGEIYVAVSHATDDFAAVPVFWAAIVVMLGAWLLFLLTRLPTSWVLGLQGVVFIALCLLLSNERVRPIVVPRRLKAASVHRAAETLFLSHGLHLTEARTGVLLFVSLAERRVEVIADRGIHRKVDQATWDSVVAHVTQAARAGTLAEGLARGVAIIGAVLAEHFPPGTQDRNELADQILEL